MDEKPLGSVSIGAKIALIALTFSLPIGVLVYLMVDSINANITVATLEKTGNAYMRPLDAALERLQDYQSEWARCGKGICNLAPAAERMNAAIKSMAAAEARYGTDLKFTPGELLRRGREYANAAAFAEQWQKVKAQDAKATEEQFDDLAGTLRTMITHAGDTSNLILDPDLDTYYLMDVTLIAMPKSQDRMGEAGVELQQVLGVRLDDPQRRHFAVLAAALRDDKERINASVGTSLNEDANFYGVSPTLAALKLPLARYAKASTRLHELISAAAESGVMDSAEFAPAIANARQSAFEFWNAAVDQLDVMLDQRASSYRSSRTHALTWSGLALAVAGVLAFSLARSITQPLGTLMRSLGPGATLLGECVTRISEVSQSQTVDPMEARIICGELDAHAESMRKAVMALARQVSGTGAEEMAAEATGPRS